jgi:hypothetical protein
VVTATETAIDQVVAPMWAHQGFVRTADGAGGGSGGGR